LLGSLWKPLWGYNIVEGVRMSEFFDWLTTTPLGLAAALGGLVIFFVLVAVLYERKTRKLYPDRNRRGTKAATKAKKKRAQAEAAKSKSKETAAEPKKKKQEPGEQEPEEQEPETPAPETRAPASKPKTAQPKKKKQEPEKG